MHNKSKRVIIIGSGIAGLTVAMELAERNFQVELYEAEAFLGGKCFSYSQTKVKNGLSQLLYGEHGFRFFLASYYHLFDTMKRIPLDGDKEQQTTFHNLSVIQEMTLGENTYGRGVQEDYRINVPIQLAQLFLTSEERAHQEFGDLVWEEMLFEKLEKFMPKTEIMDWARVLQLLQATKTDIACAACMLKIYTRAIQDPRTYILNGPTNDTFIKPWIAHLKKLGVKIFPEHKLTTVNVKDEIVENLIFTHHEREIKVSADIYLLGTSLTVTQSFIQSNKQLQTSLLLKVLNLKSAWMSGIQFFLKEGIDFPNGHIGLERSPWALSLVQQTTYWTSNYTHKLNQGGIGSILSVVISDFNTPGILYHKSAKNCTKEELIEEINHQIKTFSPAIINQAFQKTRIIDYLIDPFLSFNDKVITNKSPLFINTVGSWKNRPSPKTGIDNLFIAGDYIQTRTDVASMESANEAGKLATNHILTFFNSNSKKCQLHHGDKTTISSSIAFLLKLDQILFTNGFKHPFEYFSNRTQRILKKNIGLIVETQLQNLSSNISYTTYPKVFLTAGIDILSNPILRKGFFKLIRQYIKGLI